MQTRDMMGAPDRSRDLRAELIADLEQIEDNIALYKAGRDSAFQTVALQLRNVLLGGRRGLLLRVLPRATLHRFTEPEAPDEPAVDPTPDEELPAGWKRGTHDVVLFGHATISPPWRGERGKIALPIDEHAVSLPVGAWLEQWIIRQDVKIRALISSTANEEVAHTEDERGELLAKLAGSGLLRISREDLEAGRLNTATVAQEMYQMAIIGIGEYVARRVRDLLGKTPPWS